MFHHVIRKSPSLSLNAEKLRILTTTRKSNTEAMADLTQHGERNVRVASVSNILDLPLNVHPVAVRVSGFCTPSGAGGLTDL